MDFKRIILWAVVVLGLTSIWQNWQHYNNPPAQPSTQAVTASTTPHESTVPELAIPAINASELIHVNTDVLRLAFDPKGAKLVYAELLKHKDTRESSVEKNLVLLNYANNDYFVVESGLAGQFPNSETLFTLKTPLNALNFLKDGTLPISFEATANGIQLIRTYTLHRDSYRIDVKDNITNITDVPQTPKSYYQIIRDNSEPPGASSFDQAFHGLAIYTDEDKFEKISISDVLDGSAAKYANKKTKEGWISFIQHYFVVAWVPNQTVEHTVSALAWNQKAILRTLDTLKTLAPNESTTTEATLWVGPQDQQTLAHINPTLNVVVDYGFVTILAKPMFAFMSWIHSIVGNWGWTIIILTIIIKLILFPLSAASYKSMAKMKRVTPRMQALREQYGDDRQGLNAAMLELYRTEKINPLGGCLPILLQIPVFLTLFRVIQSSVELRGAPWLGWIHDLSVGDPLYILPALMMASMFLQFKLNPRPADPMQARMMLIMPLVFGVFMFFFPSGLVLYWLVNNLLSIAQQAYISRRYNTEVNEAILTHK